MSSDNIFRRSTAVDHSVRPTSMFKDRSSPYRRPYEEEKKKKKHKPNALLDLEVKDSKIKLNTATILDKIMSCILSLIGKKKQWEETRLKLKTLQNRITDFENVINSSNKNTYSSVRLKDYSV